jgi:hypothetical protein
MNFLAKLTELTFIKKLRFIRVALERETSKNKNYFLIG